MSTDFDALDPVLLRARIDESLGAVASARIDFAGPRLGMPLEDVLGKVITLEMNAGAAETRSWHLHCTAIECLGRQGGHMLYTAELHSWLWFLTRRRNMRIFKEMSVPDIVEQVIEDYGFAAYIRRQLTEAHEPRVFTVQYRETDLDFISRLMEEEGIHHATVHADGEQRLYMADYNAGYPATTGSAVIEYYDRSAGSTPFASYVYAMQERKSVATGKVRLDDYDFKTPSAKNEVKLEISQGHPQAKLEDYDYPALPRSDAGGKFSGADTVLRARMEEHAARHQRWVGLGNHPHISLGGVFTLREHPTIAADTGLLPVRISHQLRLLEEDLSDPALLENWGTPLDFGEDSEERYRAEFEVQDEKIPYRAPLATPRPVVAGLHTATVIGRENAPADEEIDTDEFGRILVKFNWHPDAGSCRVRVMTPWASAGFGVIVIPRIGDEVAIVFEEGDPDRPLCIGSLYNGANKVPYKLPENMTQTGIKTNSSKGGGGFNELRFEDKKDSEEVYFQAEKDYNQVVKNHATMTVGLEKGGNMDLTVNDDLTEIVKKGDHSFTVESGSQRIEIAQKREAIIGDHDWTRVDKDKYDVVRNGYRRRVMGKDDQLEVNKGDFKRTLDMGNESVKLKMGNRDVKADLGKITYEAMQKIELKVGQSSVVIDQTGVTIKGMMVKVEASIMLDQKGLMTQIKGDAMLILKGGITLIN
jgi:type VI secretion system secreted protein VgrG